MGGMGLKMSTAKPSAVVTAEPMSAPPVVRIVMAFAFLAPLGICLGAFMPMGLRTVSELGTHVDEYVAWGWAVNGFFSVIGSIASTILAMLVGFGWLLQIALAAYAIAAIALWRLPQPQLAPGGVALSDR